MARRKSAKTSGVQRRDVNAANRAVAALDLAIAGHDWDSIAKQAGYASRGSAYNAVQRELERRIDSRVDALRTLALARIMRLRTIYFPKALDGDGWSMDRCLRLDEREAALMGLDARPDVAAAAMLYTKRIILEEQTQTVPPVPPPPLSPPELVTTPDESEATE